MADGQRDRRDSRCIMCLTNVAGLFSSVDLKYSCEAH